MTTSLSCGQQESVSKNEWIRVMLFSTSKKSNPCWYIYPCTNTLRPSDFFVYGCHRRLNKVAYVTEDDILWTTRWSNFVPGYQFGIQWMSKMHHSDKLAAKDNRERGWAPGNNELCHTIWMKALLGLVWMYALTEACCIWYSVSGFSETLWWLH